MSSMRGYVVYILLCKGGTFYTGIARDVEARFREHRRGEGAKYTVAHRPIRIVYTEQKRSRSTALKREFAIKQMSHAEKLALIQLAKPTK